MRIEYVRKPNLDRASRFLRRYEDCRRLIGEQERLMSLFDKNTPGADTDAGMRAQSQNVLYRRLAPTHAEVWQSLTENYRLFERMTASLSHGIRRIPEKRERDYLVFHYFYHFTHESIAEVLHYSERQIYRVACAARTSLSKTLRTPPMARHLKFRRYRARFHKKTEALLPIAS